MNNEAKEFFQNIDPDSITPETAAQMIEMGLEGDTGKMLLDMGDDSPNVPAGNEGDGGQVDASADPQTENSDAAGDAGVGDSTENGDSGETATGEQVTPKEQGDAAHGDTANAGETGEGNGETPVLLARDGKHTIPYEKLVEAREGERQWREKAEAALSELEKLKAQAQERAEAGEEPTETDKNAAIAQDAIENGVDPDIFGDFTEEDLAKGVAKLVKMQLDQELQKIQQRQSEQSAAEAHYRAIYEAHPDADSIAESKEMADWIESQPDHVKIGIQTVMQSGTAQQVIAVFDAFKQATGKSQQQQQQPTAEALKASAKDVIDKSARSTVPASLSDIPGGTPAPGNLEDQLDNLDGKDLLERMQDMPPEKIEYLLNKLA